MNRIQIPDESHTDFTLLDVDRARRGRDARYARDVQRATDVDREPHVLRRHTGIASLDLMEHLRKALTRDDRAQRVEQEAASS